jgi:2-polyprenyl-6-methoxyphenol hydroxylase-like FAD-dependent oxidoreductase
MKLDCDVTIVGGGLNGPALALALAQTGHSVTIIDALPKPTRKTGDPPHWHWPHTGYWQASASGITSKITRNRCWKSK